MFYVARVSSVRNKQKKYRTWSHKFDTPISFTQPSFWARANPFQWTARPSGSGLGWWISIRSRYSFPEPDWSNLKTDWCASWQTCSGVGLSTTPSGLGCHFVQINIWLRGTPDFLIPVPTSGETMLLNQTNNTLFEKGFLVLPRSFSYCCAVSTEIEGTAYPSVLTITSMFTAISVKIAHPSDSRLSWHAQRRRLRSDSWDLPNQAPDGASCDLYEGLLYSRSSNKAWYRNKLEGCENDRMADKNITRRGTYIGVNVRLDGSTLRSYVWTTDLHPGRSVPEVRRFGGVKIRCSQIPDQKRRRGFQAVTP